MPKKSNKKKGRNINKNETKANKSNKGNEDFKKLLSKRKKGMITYKKLQNIGFNTRGQRFNYKYDMEKSSPGPGSYSPNGSSINGKTDYSTAIFQNNSSKKNKTNHGTKFRTIKLFNTR